MATEILKRMTEDGTHAVGSVSSIQVKTLAHGAKVVDAPVDNWTLIELAGFGEDGERLCKAVTKNTSKAYLVATPEQRFLDEEVGHFFNDVGEFVRPIVFEQDYTRFEASNYSLNSDVTEAELGLVAHFDVTTKKYILSKSDSAHVDFAEAAYQFEVVGDTSDTAGNFLQPTVRLMCTKIS